MKKIYKILLWIFVGLLSLGQLQRIELFNSQINIYLHDIFLLFFNFHVLFTRPIIIKRLIKKISQLDRKYILFTGFLFFSSIFNSVINTDLISILYICRFLLYLFFGLSLIILINNAKYEKEYLKFQFFSVGVMSLFLGFLQYIFIPDTKFLATLGWDDHYARLISTYFDPGFTGIIFIITLFLGLSSSYIQNRIARAAVSIIFSWGIILTFSRASYLAFLLGIGTVAISESKVTMNKISKIVLGTVIVLFLIFIAPKPYGEGVNLLRTSTIDARIQAATDQIKNITLKTTLMGNGMFSKQNSITYQATNLGIFPSHSRVPDNIFITVFLSGGIFSLLLFLDLILQFATYLRKQNKYSFAILVSVLLHAQFSNTILQPFVLLIILGAFVSLQTKRVNDL